MDDGVGNDEIVASAPAPAKARVTGRQPRVWAVIRRRGTELLVVFFGVYAAFLLNRFDTDRRDAKRRAQILESLDQEVATNLDELKNDVSQAEGFFADFDRRLASGEMPPLSVSFVDSGYSSSDDAALLQAGGLELLDIQTVERIRVVNDLERSLLAFTHDQFELGLAELTNHAPGDFYDPATHQLKKRYDWYPRLQHKTLAQAKELLAVEEKLLTHLRAVEHPDGAEALNPAPSSAVQPTPRRSPAAPRPAD